VLRRSVKIQLLAFVVIALLGITYVSARYVGLGGSLLGEKKCTISADFPDSGGIFTGAEVTFRGVGVGMVGQLHLLDDGVRVDLHLNSCNKPSVPDNANAYVSDRSAVGEQYVNLVPPDPTKTKQPIGPALKPGGVLKGRGEVPIATQVLITNLDLLVKSVDPGQLTTTLDELQNALNGRGPDLQRLLDSGDQLLTAAMEALPQTISLINASKTVLQTQLHEGSAIKAWTHDLQLLTAQLKTSDGDLRSLLDTGPSALSTIRSFVTDNHDDLGVLLTNTASTGKLIVRHLDGVEEILELYPNVVAGAQTVVPGDGTAHFGLVLNFNDPQDCAQGYGGTAKRGPLDTAPATTNTDAQCTLPRGNPSSVRGAQNAPGGDPVSTAGGGTVYPRASTSNTVLVGGSSVPSAAVLGDKSWLTLLTDGLN